MALKIKQNGEVKDLIIPACGVEVLDMDGRFNSKNLEDVLKEVGSSTETNMTRIENKVEQLSNPNLLINGDFQVWTRGTEFTDPREYNGECANRWFWNYSVVQGSKINKVDGGLKITYLKDCTTALIYKMSFEDKKSLLGKQLTVSFELNGTKYQKSFTLKNLRESLVFETDFKIHTGYNEDSNDVVYLNPTRKQGVELIVKDMKLEIGSKVTPFDHKPYSMELENSIKYDVNGNYKQIYSNPNLLINGDFQVWQRGTKFNVVNNGSYTYTADRWVVQTDSTSITANSLPNNGMRVDMRRFAGTYLNVMQLLEIPDYQKLIGKDITIRVKFKNDVSDIYIGVRAFPDQASTHILIPETKREFTITAKVPECSTDCTKFMIYVQSRTNQILDFDYIKVELGLTATPFIPRPYAEELALCQRYYQYNPRDSWYQFHRSHGGGLRCDIPTKSMRFTPTLVFPSENIDIFNNASQWESVSRSKCFVVQSFASQITLSIDTNTPGLIDYKTFIAKNIPSFDAEIY